MRIAIRVDASPAIGTGHVRRSLALAHALRDLGADVRFITRALGTDSAAMIAAAGFKGSIILPAPDEFAAPDPAIPHSHWAQVSAQTDAAQTAEALVEFAPDWVVLDSYAFGARWHEAMRAALGCRIAQIDDLGDRALGADLLIDHTYSDNHRIKYNGQLTPGTRLLGGPRFALLGPAYANAPRYEHSEAVRSIGIFMGGVDADNHSAAVIAALDEAGFAGPIEVVSTSANPNLDALRQAIDAHKGARLMVDLPDLADFFARHDLQVGAGGGASWERCCIGVPTVLLAVAPNQLTVATQLAAKGVAAFAEDTGIAEIADILKTLIGDAPRREAMTRRARALVDGRGAQRAALAMLSGALTLRPATTDDARMMFDWRGDPLTRAVSRESGALIWEDHLAWLDRTLADPARTLMVGEIGGRPVGVIRFDKTEGGPGGSQRAEVSLYLDPALHGLGLGSQLLLSAETATDIAIIDATVLEENAGSQALFARCGYTQTGPTRWEKRRLPAGNSTR